MTIEELLKEIKFLSTPGKGFKPHKYLALLTILQLIREKKIVSCQVLFDEAFKNRFGDLIKKYGGEADRNRPHTPFFHLATTSFWALIPNEGQESALAKASRTSARMRAMHRTGNACQCGSDLAWWIAASAWSKSPFTRWFSVRAASK